MAVADESLPASRKMERQLTAESLAAEVRAGKALIVVRAPGKEALVYDLTQWIHEHPGGELAIRHFIGRDATDAMTAFHPESVFRLRLPRFAYARFQDSELSMGADVDRSESKFRSVAAAYLALEKRVKEMGLFETDYSFYYREIVKAVVLLTGMIGAILVFGGSFFPVLASAFCAAVLWWQMAFVAHDLGHNAVSHNQKLDTAMGIALANFTGGLSIGWWKHNHNIHHLVTNDPEHDPDIQHLPFFAVSTRFFKSLYSSFYKRTLEFDEAAKMLIPWQHHLFYVILSFGRFNLYALSWIFATTYPSVPYRSWEIAGLCGFWVWFGLLLSRVDSWLLVAVYVLVSHCLTGLLHVQITLSHFGMDSSDVAGEDFATKALRTSMDVVCPRWLDWFHGGLQFQVVHHLFPRVPRHNLRKLVPLVEQFAEENGLKYTAFHFVEGNKFVLGALRDVADQVKLLGKVLEGESMRVSRGKDCKDQ
ncbi:fatty acid desaturase-domain-containing protein [Hyaloraphidium curvatum]|nr:fatty acid desaturase-domain-containing protein [Hyaloraphidium curvatum]